MKKLLIILFWIFVGYFLHPTIDRILNKTKIHDEIESLSYKANESLNNDTIK